MSCCGSITDVLKKILSAIAPIVAIALLCFAAYAIFLAGPGVLPFLQNLAWMPAGIAALEASTLGYIALGVALVISPDTVTSIVEGVGSTIGTVAGKVIAAVAGGVVGGLFGMDFSTLLGLAAVAFGVFYLIKNSKKDDAEPMAEQDARKSTSEPVKTGDTVFPDGSPAVKLGSPTANDMPSEWQEGDAELWQAT